MGEKNVAVILQRSVRNYGKCGERVSARRGYAMYMVNQGNAVFATADNIERNKHHLEVLLQQDRERRQLAEKNADVLKKAIICFVKQAGGQGKLYGSVSIGDLVAELQAECGVVVAKNQVSMSVARTTGEHRAQLHLFEGVSVDLKYYVAESDEAKGKLLAEKKSVAEKEAAKASKAA